MPKKAKLHKRKTLYHYNIFMGLTANHVNKNNKSNDRDRFILEYYYLHTDVYTVFIAIWYSWVPNKWGEGVWINWGGRVRKFWINEWEDWKNIENLIAGVRKINRLQWSWSALNSYLRGGLKTIMWVQLVFDFRLAKTVLK